MSAVRRLTVPGTRESLAAILAFVDESCDALGVPEEAAFAVRLAVEEIATNVATHGYRDGAGEIGLALAGGDAAVRITIADRAPRFDPAEAPVPDVAAPLAERPSGGLGWHLVNRLMDRVEHQDRPGGGNVVTLTKRYER